MESRTKDSVAHYPHFRGTQYEPSSSLSCCAWQLTLEVAARWSWKKAKALLMTVGLSVARTATPAAAAGLAGSARVTTAALAPYGRSSRPCLNFFLVCIADEFALEGTSAPTTADTAAVSYDDRPPWHQRSTAVTSVTTTSQWPKLRYSWNHTCLNSTFLPKWRSKSWLQRGVVWSFKPGFESGRKWSHSTSRLGKYYWSSALLSRFLLL